MKTVSFTVTIPVAVDNWLKADAQTQHRSKRAQINHILDQFYLEKRQTNPEGKGRGLKVTRRTTRKEAA